MVLPPVTGWEGVGRAAASEPAKGWGGMGRFRRSLCGNRRVVRGRERLHEMQKISVVFQPVRTIDRGVGRVQMMIGAVPEVVVQS